MDIANDLFRRFSQNCIADSMNQVCLAEAGPTIDEQGVVGSAGVVGDLNCCSPGQIIGFANNQVIEGE